MPSVILKNLRKSFGRLVAVDGISVEFAEGALTSLLGPSGCGKTTTLNLIAGFEAPDSGTICLDERPISDPARGIAVPPNRRNLGMVFQSYALWPHLTVGENVAYGLRMHGTARAAREKAVHEALHIVQLEAHLDRYPHQLSGGQQQRVALARALAYAPSILLFDEPLSNLDAQLREEMRLELKEIHRRIGVTAIYVTHDQAEAMTLSDRIIVMGQGRIRQIGTPRELYEQPADTAVAKFIGKTNLLPGTILEHTEGWALIRLDGLEGSLRCRCSGAPSNGMRGTVSIRPEGIYLHRRGSGGDETLLGHVRSASYLGNLQEYRVACGKDLLLEVQQSSLEAWQPDDEVALEIDPARACFIPDAPDVPGLAP